MRRSRLTVIWVSKIVWQCVLIVYVAFASALGWSPEPLVSVAPELMWLAVPALVTMNIWHYLILRSATRHLERPDSLVTTRGLFRFVRHPMYLGDICVLSIFALTWCNWLSLGLLVLAVMNIVLLARMEDAQLTARFGEDHQRWRGRTRLVLPLPVWRNHKGA